MINSFSDFVQIYENNKTNKFNIHWQIIRTNAKGIKNPDEKLKYVLNFLEKNRSPENFDRILNWIKMTAVAYKDNIRKTYEDTALRLSHKRGEYNQPDNDNDLSKVSTSDLLNVYKDLMKRKYGFQFKSVPKDHIEFIKSLESELANRKAI